MRHSSHFHAIRMAARLRPQRTSQPQRLRYVRRASYPASLPTRRTDAMQKQQLSMSIARNMLEVLSNDRRENGAFSPAYQASIRQLLGTLFPDMAQHDPQWPARIDAALNDEPEDAC